MKITEVANDAPAHTVFFSENLEVLFIEAATSYLLITFNEAGEPANGRTVWGDGLVRSAGITTLGFMCRSANWFPQADMHAAVVALEPLLARFRERILFGHSMGGYGAIKFSRLLGASVTLSFCPQYSIDPADVGLFDSRYVESYRPGLHGGMHIGAADIAAAIYLFHDPNLIEDQLNVDLIHRAAPSVHLVPMRNTGHGTIAAFRGTAAATELFNLCRTQGPDAVRRLAAMRRRGHPERPSLILRGTCKRHLSWAASIFRFAGKNMRPELASWFACHIATLAIQRGDKSLCRLIMQYGLEVLPNDPRPLDAFVHLLGTSGDVPGAVAMARRLTQLDPLSVAAKILLAGWLQRNGDLQAAYTEARMVLRTDPTNLHALRMLADIDRRCDRLEQAIAWLRIAVSVEPDDTALHLKIAAMLIQLDALAEARQAAETAARIAPVEAAPLKVLAEVAQRLGDLPKAVAILRRAAPLTHRDVQLHAWLAHLLMEAGEFEEARERAEHALALEPANVGALCSLVEIARRSGRPDETARWARAVARCGNADTGKLEWAAGALIQAGDLAGGGDVALSILGRDPSHIGAMTCLADICSRSGNLAHAIVWAHRVAAAAPEDADRQYHIASLQIRSGNLAAARTAALSALALEPNHRPALNCISDVDARLLGPVAAEALV
ncbi:tetratricopeptide repeat protein [Rhodopila sp.]|uniref:tetratricopeptide repeat protein n=1 Tax=Rhodopila sp. TaxID=2480087 RepID=UPI003D108C2B